MGILRTLLLDRLSGRLTKVNVEGKVLTFQLSKRDHRYPEKFLQVVPNEFGGLEIRGGIGRLKVVPQAANVIHVYYE